LEVTGDGGHEVTPAEAANIGSVNPRREQL